MFSIPPLRTALDAALHCTISTCPSPAHAMMCGPVLLLLDHHGGPNLGLWIYFLINKKNARWRELVQVIQTMPRRASPRVSPRSRRSTAPTACGVFATVGTTKFDQLVEALDSKVHACARVSVACCGCLMPVPSSLVFNCQCLHSWPFLVCAYVWVVTCHSARTASTRRTGRAGLLQLDGSAWEEREQAG